MAAIIRNGGKIIIFTKNNGTQEESEPYIRSLVFHTVIILFVIFDMNTKLGYY
jgi:hypothetical protein